MSKSDIKDTGGADVIIIGGGIFGLIALRYALKNKLKAIVLEKEPTIGGLWTKVPDWQDIQTRKEDWSIDGTPIRGEHAENIAENIFEYMRKHDLSKYINLNQEVQQVHFDGNRWQVRTNKETFVGHHLIVATGLHNRPLMPWLHREHPTIEEEHSFNFRNPERIAGQRVAIVGAGPSSYDLIELALANDAKEVHWIIRSPRWFIPSTKPKNLRPHLRLLALRQMTIKRHDNLNDQFETFLRKSYQRFGLQEIEPKGKLDLTRDQLVAGRPRIISDWNRITRHHDSLVGLHGNTLKLEEESFEADLVLYATGYELDLEYLGLERLSGIKSGASLRQRCSTLMISRDYQNLYFLGATVLDGNTTTPLIASWLARSLMLHITGEITLPDTVIENNPCHWDMMLHLAQHDKINYPLSPWTRLKYKALSFLMAYCPNLEMRFPPL